ncbi:MAG: ThiF family adenylyltransferase, partial [Thermoplasmata archaeon]
TLQALNPKIHVNIHPTTLARENALEILRPYDVIIDGTDNFSTRYLVNDACVLLGKPNVYGSIYRFEGQATVFDGRTGPCYRCLFPEPPPPGSVPSCGEAGVLGVLPGFIGLIQATEAVKLVLGIGDSLLGRLLLYDALAMRVRELRIRKDPDCVVCGAHATQHELIDYPAFCGVRAPDAEASGRPEIAPSELAAELHGPEPPTLIDVREQGEWDIVHIEGARLIPKGEVTEHLDELTPSRSLVLYCHSGRRSADATDLLLSLGFRNVRSLKGGIEAWAKEIDPSLPRY